MKARADTFNEELHKKALMDFGAKLSECKVHFAQPIVRVSVLPDYIAGITDLIDIHHKDNEKILIAQYLSLVLPMHKLVIRVYDKNNAYVELNVGIRTKKGYRSKVEEFESFEVDQNMNLTTPSIVKMMRFVHSFKVWK